MSNQDKIKSALKSIDDSLATINTNYEMLETHQYDKADRRSSVKNYFHGLIYRRHQGLGKPNKIYVHDILQPETFEWTPEIQLKKWRNKK